MWSSCTFRSLAPVGGAAGMETLVTRRFVRVTALAAAASVLASTAAFASPDFSASTRDHHEMEDNVRIAEEEGISVEQVNEETRLQTRWVEHVNEIAETYPEVYAGSDFNPGGVPRIRLKGSTNAQAIQNQLSVDFPRVQMSTSDRHSEVEQDALVAAAVDFAVDSQGDSGGDLFAEYVQPDSSTGSRGGVQVTTNDSLTATSIREDIEAAPLVEVEISGGYAPEPPPAVTADPDPDADLYEIPDSAGDGYTFTVDLSEVVEVTADPTAELNATAVAGGQRLNRAGTKPPQLACTSAFPVRTSNGRTGLLTADHCRDKLDVDDRDSLYDASIFLNRKKGDAQWHRAKETVLPQFRYDWGKWRQTKTRLDPTVGTRVCVMGSASGARCRVVANRGVTVHYKSINKTYNGMTITGGMRSSTSPGDSGGPWYYGRNAYGTQSGIRTIGRFKHELFTPASTAMKSMGLTLIVPSK